MSPPGLDAAFDLALAWMNGADVDEGEYATVFAEPFVTAVPFVDFQALAVDIAADGPWTFAGTLGEDASGGAYEVTSAAGEASVVQLEIDAAQRQITSLLVQPKPEFSPPADQAEAVSRLEQLGNLRLAVLDATAGACTTVVDEGVLEVMPLGSAFKLYVLGAVSAAVGAGTIAWDTLVTIDDALDSLPPGTTQNIEPGTEVQCARAGRRNDLDLRQHRHRSLDPSGGQRGGRGRSRHDGKRRRRAQHAVLDDPRSVHLQIWSGRVW